MLRIFEDQKVSDSLRSVAEAVLCPKSLLPRDGADACEYCSSSGLRGPQPRRAEARNGIRIVAFPAGRGPKTFPSRHLRLFEPRSSPPPHRDGLLSHSDRRRQTASHSPQTKKTTKNARILLDVAIIYTTFWPSDPSKETWIELLLPINVESLRYVLANLLISNDINLASVLTSNKAGTKSRI